MWWFEKDSDSSKYQKLLTARLQEATLPSELTTPDFWSMLSTQSIQRCPSSWYYRYILARNGWSSDASNLNRLAYSLKHLLNFDSAICTSVEKSFAYYLQINLNRRLVLKNAIKTAWLHLQSQVNNSSIDQRLYDPVLPAVEEIFYGKKFHFKETADRLRLTGVNVIKCLNSKINHRRNNSLRVIDDSSLLKFEIEGTTIFIHNSTIVETSDGFVDYVFLQPGEISGDFCRRKAALAAIHAEEKLGIRYQRVKSTFLGEMGDSEVNIFATPKDIDSVKKQVQQDTELIRSKHQSLAEGNPWQEVYPHNNGNHCNHCQFRLICPKYDKKSLPPELRKAVGKILK